MKSLAYIVALVLLVAAGREASAEDPRNPGFDTCSSGAKHAAVPEVKRLIYDRARKKIVADGWTPRVTVKNDDQIHFLTMYGGNAEIFWSRGYREVEVCAPTGHAACNFHFVDRFGNRLEIGTSGEERRKYGGRAIVDYVQLLCPKH